MSLRYLCDFYSRRVLRLSSGIDDMGQLLWDLALTLVLAWLLTFFGLFKGIKVTGKVRRPYDHRVFCFLLRF